MACALVMEGSRVVSTINHRSLKFVVMYTCSLKRVGQSAVVRVSNKCLIQR